MKVQIRQGVFETNSSSTHSLAIYNKKEWEEFKNGDLLMDDGSYLGNLKKKEDFRENYKRYLEWYDRTDESEEDFEDWINDNTQNYETFEEEYEVLTEEIPDSDYIAVSIFSYEG